jgi:hypothetical protein
LKGLSARTLAFERHRRPAGHKSSKERSVVVCYGNSSANPKLKLVVIGKTTKPQLFSGTEENCIPVHYYNQKRTYVDREIF